MYVQNDNFSNIYQIVNRSIELEPNPKVSPDWNKLFWDTHHKSASLRKSVINISYIFDEIVNRHPNRIIIATSVKNLRRILTEGVANGEINLSMNSEFTRTLVRALVQSEIIIKDPFNSVPIPTDYEENVQSIIDMFKVDNQ